MIKLFHRELANGVGRGVSKTVGGVTIWQQVEGEGKLDEFFGGVMPLQQVVVEGKSVKLMSNFD